jgi:acetylornithine deacetylase
MHVSSADLLARLVGFDTVSRNSNLPLMDFVQAHLADLGIESVLVPDETGTKANLIATIGPAGRAGLVLSGHTDVVPVDGQPWTSDPFVATRRGQRILGRGTADMKGFIACVLASVPLMQAARLTRPIHLAFSYDEEVGCKGVPSLLDRMATLLPAKPLGCIVGEPTLMRLVDGHKGKAACRVTVRGREGHSALTHETVNAVMYAAEIIGFVRRTASELAAQGPFGEGFVPPHTTANVGRIEGGGQLNIVPGTCWFELEFRALPDQDPRDWLQRIRAHAEALLLPEMRRIAPEAEIGFEEFMFYPGLGAGKSGAFEHWARRLAGTDEPGKVAFGTEGGHFAARGIPSVVCGPGDIAVAHKPDEYVELDQLRQCDAFLERVIRGSAEWPEAPGSC